MYKKLNYFDLDLYIYLLIKNIITKFYFGINTIKILFYLYILPSPVYILHTREKFEREIGSK